MLPTDDNEYDVLFCASSTVHVVVDAEAAVAPKSRIVA